MFFIHRTIKDGTSVYDSSSDLVYISLVKIVTLFRFGICQGLICATVSWKAILINDLWQLENALELMSRT